MYEQAAAELANEQGRRSGLDRQNRGYDQRFATIESSLTKVVEAMGQMAAPVAQPPQAQAPVPTGEPLPPVAPQVPEAFLDLQVEVAELRAEGQRRDIIGELSQPGQPGAGIDWSGAEEWLPLSQDADEMRGSLTKFAEWASKGQGQAATQRENALLQGMTPGSSPPPVPGLMETPRQEFDALHTEVQDTHVFRKLPKEERDEKYARYLDLGEKYGYTASTEWTQGWDTFEGLRRAQNQVLRRLDAAGIATIDEMEKVGTITPVGGV
jgi:hypothetical protein